MSSVVDDTVWQSAQSLLGKPASRVAQGGRGGNNRLYRVEDGRGQAFALKYYPLQSEDQRDRLGVEFNSLTFMARHGIETVPKAIALDRARHCALYEWIEGQSPATTDESDIDAALALAEKLFGLARGGEAQSLPPSSAACWSAHALIAQIKERRSRLDDAAKAEPALRDFLQSAFDPAFHAARREAEQAYAASGWDFEANLPPEALTLSPSDFGFHNALRRADNSLVFIDFEYFGWDDPAKLASDFLHHPGMRLSDGQMERFRSGVLRLFSRDKTFAQRLSLLFPLYGLCWCMILLNEFLPEGWSRRRLAGAEDNRAAVLERQLTKARHKLEDVTSCQWPSKT
jgi:hypothetical protein